MKKKLTRSELEAIGENWFQRRNKLLAIGYDPKQNEGKQARAIRMAWIMNARIAKIVLILGQHKAPNAQKFPPGGIPAITQPEYMHRVETAFATGKTYPTLIALEDECAKCCAVQPEWQADFKKIRRTFYSEERAQNGADILQEIRRRLLSAQTEAAKRLLDKALDLQ